MLKKEAEVLLINPPYVFKESNVRKRTKGLWPPLGLLYLAAILEKENISVKVLDLMAKDLSIEETLTLVKETNAKVVGITGTTYQLRGMILLGEALKDFSKQELSLVAGGSHVSADPNFIEKFPFFDFIIVGEGETTFTELVKRILNGEKCINRVCQGKTCEDLDALPFPSRHLLDWADYSNGRYGSRFSTIHSSRGCLFNCIFCSNALCGRRVRYRAPENVVDEIEECHQKYGSAFFIFTDDTFTLKRERVVRICEEIVSRGLKIRWNCETRANLVDEKLLSLMKNSGCEEIFFGVESGSERIRNEVIHKQVKDEDIYNAFKVSKKLGMITNAFLMAGFPTETQAELKETFDFCFKAKPDVIGLHLTTILPGAPIFDIALKEGKITPNVWNDYANGKVKDQPIYVPDGLTLQDLEDFQKNLYRKFYFRREYIIRRLKFDIKSFAQLREDAHMAWTLLRKGRTTARSHKKEDYY